MERHEADAAAAVALGDRHDGLVDNHDLLAVADRNGEIPAGEEEMAEDEEDDEEEKDESSAVAEAGAPDATTELLLTAAAPTGGEEEEEEAGRTIADAAAAPFFPGATTLGTTDFGGGGGGDDDDENGNGNVGDERGDGGGDGAPPDPHTFPAGDPIAAAAAALESAGGAEAISLSRFGVNYRRSAEWTAKLNELLAYKKEHGDCRVPKDYALNPALAMWCDNQRRQKKLREEGKKSSMTDERETALNDVGFWWGWRIVPFEDRLEEYRQFREANGGRSRVSHSDGPRHHALRDWLKAQRERYHEGLLDDERRVRLEEAGFDFGVRMLKWDDHFRELIRYRDRFGHCNVNKDDEEGEYGELFRWVKRQRALYAQMVKKGAAVASPSKKSSGAVKSGAGAEEEVGAGAGGTPAKTTSPKGSNRTKDFGLTDERLAKLVDVGFLFSTWDVRYSELVRYVEKRGGSLPDLPTNAVAARKYARKLAEKKGSNDGDADADADADADNDNETAALMRWLINQRRNYPAWLAGKDSPLTDDRVVRLLKLGFEFDPPPAKSSQRHDPAAGSTGGRGQHPSNSSKLIVDSVWKKQLGVLRAFRDMFGHCDVPPNFGMNRELAHWVQKQRAEYKIMTEGKGEEDDEGENPTATTSEAEAEAEAATAAAAEKKRKEREECSMTEKRAEELRAVGFAFTREEEQWNEKLRDLVALGEERGSTTAAVAVRPREGKQRRSARDGSDVDREDAALSRWVTEQRRQFEAWRRGEASALTDLRVKAMKAARFPFVDAGVDGDARGEEEAEEIETEEEEEIGDDGDGEDDADGAIAAVPTPKKRGRPRKVSASKSSPAKAEKKNDATPKKRGRSKKEGGLPEKQTGAKKEEDGADSAAAATAVEEEVEAPASKKRKQPGRGGRGTRAKSEEAGDDDSAADAAAEEEIAVPAASKTRRKRPSRGGGGSKMSSPIVAEGGAEKGNGNHSGDDDKSPSPRKRGRPTRPRGAASRSPSESVGAGDDVDADAAREEGVSSSPASKRRGRRSGGDGGRSATSGKGDIPAGVPGTKKRGRPPKVDAKGTGRKTTTPASRPGRRRAIV